MTRLGPADPARSVAAAGLLPAARAAASAAGVTRLADVTRLDRLGLPVWQAVRPMSRALSVHQGKGATEADAQVGALLEAVESHSAETFDADGPVCSFDALPERGCPPTIADFAHDRAHPPAADSPVRWVEAGNLLGGPPVFLPFDLVSLDLARDVPSPFDRASNGIGAGATREEACAVALRELIERDAVTEWSAGGMLGCMECTLDPATVPFDWFGLWRERVASAGASLRCYAVPSLTGTPVFACEINDGGKDGAPYRAVQGRGCHPDPEVALFKAVAEAIQGRATYVAGARDDLFPGDYLRPDSAIVVAFGLPSPPGMEGADFASVAPVRPDAAAEAEALARAGCGPVALIELARPEGLAVVRAFACGLGSMTRRRRADLG